MSTISRVTLFALALRLAVFGGAMVPALIVTLIMYVCDASVHLMMAVLFGIAALGAYLGRRATIPAR
jgi:hypothetical protein